jgi:hypothetical protein
MKMERLDIYLYTYLEINKADFVQGTMYFYEIDGSNLLSPLSDSEGEICLPSPILADANGRFPDIYIKKPYRVIVYDRTGVNMFEGSYS